ncbi:MAG: protein-methionine-sulfoxide reductase catalytic subunit MsrP [Alphaproteobacteria bacterium]|nr:protein-methionine-sulfoxide reductase catalytic subunit MsrP [Alphaproteobacteria bacterium]
MLIRRKRGWEVPESSVTPERLVLNRRRLLGAGAVGVGSLALQGQGWFSFGEQKLPDFAAGDPSLPLYPAMRSMRYRVDREMTEEKVAVTYNNFYEFGSSKNIWQGAQKLPIRPWEVRIDGMVEEPRTVAIDDLLKAMQLEERAYRFRCVEAWAMTVPWTGFAMKSFVEYCKPLGSAKYIRMETFKNVEVASGQRASWYPWPYVEGLAIDEAMNELTLLATGVYGKPLPKQMGAPVRLVVPWKYGFKNIKSIVRFHFTDRRPKSFWEEVQGAEYGFWANVNPKVAHPRWSQATEELIGKGGERVPTQMFNGYGDFVASLYAGRENEKLWM